MKFQNFTIPPIPQKNSNILKDSVSKSFSLLVKFDFDFFILLFFFIFFSFFVLSFFFFFFYKLLNYIKYID